MNIEQLGALYAIKESLREPTTEAVIGKVYNLLRKRDAESKAWLKSNNDTDRENCITAVIFTNRQISNLLKL